MLYLPSQCALCVKTETPHILQPLIPCLFCFRTDCPSWQLCNRFQTKCLRISVDVVLILLWKISCHLFTFSRKNTNFTIVRFCSASPSLVLTTTALYSIHQVHTSGAFFRCIHQEHSSGAFFRCITPPNSPAEILLLVS